MAVTYSVQVYEVDGNAKPAQAYNFPASSLAVPYNGSNADLNSVIYPGNGHGYAVAETQAELNDLASTYSVDVYEIDGNTKATPVSYNFPGSSFVTPYNGNNADLNSIIYPGDGHSYSVAETADALNTLANAGGGGGGGVSSVNTGSGITVDNTDPTAPIVNLGGTLSGNAVLSMNEFDFTVTYDGQPYINAVSSSQPTASDTYIAAYNNAGDGSKAQITCIANDTDETCRLESNFNDGTKRAIIALLANATISSITSNATHHNFVGLQDFANNAAAVSGGLNVGDLYYTNTAGQATLKIVV